MLQRTGWGICILLCFLLSAAWAQTGARVQKDVPVLFKADQLRNEQRLGLVVATGNVELSQGARTLLADSVTYNRRDDTVTAAGNVSLLEPTGEVIFADRVNLSGDLRYGVIENMRIRLSEDARIAAAGARRIGGQKTVFQKAVYSPCKLCEEDPSRAPIWQIKAYRVEHNQKSKNVSYRDAYLEFHGIPVFYTPYFSHPDPTVERRTGFLVPSYGNDSDLGFLVKTPFYIDIAPNMDATITPTFTSGEGIVSAGEFRHRLSNTDYVLSGSLTQGSKESGDDDNIRGHIRGDLNHETDGTWRGGTNIFLVTDDTYLRRYKFESKNTLENRLYAEGFGGRSFASANAYYFRGLQADDDPGDTPIVLPKLDFNYVGEPGSFGGQWQVDANFLGLTRTDGTNTRRVSALTKWELPHTTAFGEIYRVFASLQTDAYQVNDVVDPDNTLNTKSGFTGRVFPQAGLDWRLPLARTDGRFTQVVEPIVSFILAPDGQNRELIPNEDSLSFEFDDTNLFSENRFTGIDRVEGGPRITYGLNSGVFGLNSGSSSFFIGQSYRLDESDDFGTGTGLDEHFSDIVGRVRITPSQYINALYKFRLDKDDLSSSRNELEGNVGTDSLRLDVNYLSIDQQEIESALDPDDNFRDREEISLGLSSRFFDFYQFGINTRRDLTSGGGTLRHSAFFRYADDCFEFGVDYNRAFTRDRDVQPTDTIMFRVVFRTLGEVENSTAIN
jgi:LPS-assembly protein